MLFDIVPYNRKNPSFFAEDLIALIGHLSQREIEPLIAAQMPLEEAEKPSESQKIFLCF